MKIQTLLVELKERVDKLPKEANWFGNVDAIKQLIASLEKELKN